VLVRDLGDAYAIVLQPDHGELAGGLAAAWAGDAGLPAELRAALTVAAARHDDGWAVWERHPRLDPDGGPVAFFAADVESLLGSYRASAEVLVAEDELAGLLVSRHVSGLQRGRYGSMGDATKPLETLAPAVRAFVDHEESRQAALAGTHRIAAADLDRAYALLQVLDVLSLHLGLTPDEPRTIATAPAFGIALELTPQGDTIQVAPYPFAADPLELTLRRRVLREREWKDETAFRADFHAAPTEAVEIRIASI
jgi:hypothetical protein